MRNITSKNIKHIPVLIDSVLNGLSIKKNGIYIDATFGRGGHSREILSLLGEKGKLIAIDRDSQAIREADDIFTHDMRFKLIMSEFDKLKKIANEKNVLKKVDGLLFDLGVSSPQFDEASRGFSFQNDGLLDMRMNTEKGKSAAEWLATTSKKELAKILFEYGEERFANRIANAIIKEREVNPIHRTKQLAQIVAKNVPYKRRIHPATKTFQAIRIFINNELEQLDAALEASIEILKKGGRLCVISFHSLEDRKVKRFFRNASHEDEQYRGMPFVPEEYRPKLKIIGKTIKTSFEEMERNIRSRSARLRIAERI